MITFTPFRTPRLTVQLIELTIGASIELCSRPASRHEANTSALLAHIVAEPDRIVPGQVYDPRLWTVEERGALVAHYLAHSIGPEFTIGDNAKYPDFLFQEQQTAEEIPIGPVAEDEWHVGPLLGYQAESIERLILNGRAGVSGRMGWTMCAMACQMRRTQEEALEDIGDADFDNWLEHRLAVFKAYPESTFALLLDAFLAARHAQRHLLQSVFNDEGVVFVSEVPGLPSARFPVSDVFSDRTARFLGIATKPEGGAD